MSDNQVLLIRDIFLIIYASFLTCWIIQILFLQIALSCFLTIIKHLIVQNTSLCYKPCKDWVSVIFFCKCIKMLYSNGNSSIHLNNGTSPRFSLNRGVRQGCPIFPYLFLLATQFLNVHIKESPVKGISIAGTDLFISQLAALFLRDASQIPIALSSLQYFSNASGLCLILINANYFQ